MTDQPDFEELRAKRNAKFDAFRKRFAEEADVDPESIFTSHNPNACYCACASEARGPCEHKWDGPDWESEDRRACSVTCSRCGMTAMSHDMRCGP